MVRPFFRTLKRPAVRACPWSGDPDPGRNWRQGRDRKNHEAGVRPVTESHKTPRCLQQAQELRDEVQDLGLCNASTVQTAAQRARGSEQEREVIERLCNERACLRRPFETFLKVPVRTVGLIQVSKAAMPSGFAALVFEDLKLPARCLRTQ